MRPATPCSDPMQQLREAITELHEATVRLFEHTVDPPGAGRVGQRGRRS